MHRRAVSGARRAFLQALLCAAVLGLGAPTASRAARWWRLPLWGAEVRAFAIDPFSADTVYLGTSRGNFYGSTDGGAMWKPLHAGPAFPGYVVTALVADPS